MKKSIKKFVIACASVTAVSAAFAASAMAADLAPTYDSETHSVAITLPAMDTGAEATVLVLGKDKTLTSEITDGDILYVNQAANGDFDGAEATTETLKLLSVGGGLEDGTYTVAVGYYKDGEFAIADGTFTLGATYTKGDVNNDTYVNGSDAALVIQEFITPDTLDETQKLAADVNGDGKYNGSDAAAIISYFINGNWD